MTKIAHRTRDQEQNGALAERNEEVLTQVARASEKMGADVVRDAANVSRSAADAVEKLNETTLQLTKESPELGRAFAELLEEQTDESAETLSVFARSVNWSDVMHAQSRLMNSSFMRISQFNARYGQFMLRGMTAIPTLARR